ncbi:hypothetical protein DICA1_F33034 [Diutina catenulata]
MFILTGLAAAAITFIVLETFFFGFVFFTKEVTRIVYFLVIYTTLRLGSQCIALVIAKDGLKSWSAFAYTFLSTWPIAFLIFSSSCFVLSTFENPLYGRETSQVYVVHKRRMYKYLGIKGIIMLYASFGIACHVVGTALIIHIPLDEVLQSSRWITARKLRTAGNAVYMAHEIAVCIVAAFRFRKYRGTTLAFSFVSTLMCCVLVTISLIHGWMQLYIDKMNLYYDVHSFVKYEYCIAMMPEFLCSILASYSYCCMDRTEVIVKEDYEYEETF